MSESGARRSPVQKHHEQMLRLVARSFYTELIKYGVSEAEVLSVAGHLLDNVMQKGNPIDRQADTYSTLFSLRDVEDSWETARRLQVHDVALRPLLPEDTPVVRRWLDDPSTRESFHPPFPLGLQALEQYFQAADRDYFIMLHAALPAGLIGAEHLDATNGKLEMRKLVGDPRMHGKGIGKRATFLFLYHSFCIRKFNKVYLHSMDINIRNLNLNRKFGFELEGVFLEDALVDGTPRNIVRMALFAAVWKALFS